MIDATTVVEVPLAPMTTIGVPLPDGWAGATKTVEVLPPLAMIVAKVAPLGVTKEEDEEPATGIMAEVLLAGVGLDAGVPDEGAIDVSEVGIPDVGVLGAGVVLEDATGPAAVLAVFVGKIVVPGVVLGVLTGVTLVLRIITRY